jgi:hypothetical protein
VTCSGPSERKRRGSGHGCMSISHQVDHCLVDMLTSLLFPQDTVRWTTSGAPTQVVVCSSYVKLNVVPLTCSPHLFPQDTIVRWTTLGAPTQVVVCPSYIEFSIVLWTCSPIFPQNTIVRRTTLGVLTQMVVCLSYVELTVVSSTF